MDANSCSNNRNRYACGWRFNNVAAALTAEVALESAKLNLAHSDPFDRLIAAPAKYFNRTLVTADEKLIGSPDYTVLANR